MKRIALKFCGGCDCTYDRLQYWQEIKTAAENIIEWVTLDDDDFDTVLMIHGCQIACPEKVLDARTGWRIVTVIDEKIPAKRIVQRLLNKNEF